MDFYFVSSHIYLFVASWMPLAVEHPLGFQRKDERGRASEPKERKRGAGKGCIEASDVGDEKQTKKSILPGCG